MKTIELSALAPCMLSAYVVFLQSHTQLMVKLLVKLCEEEEVMIIVEPCNARAFSAKMTLMLT